MKLLKKIKFKPICICLALVLFQAVLYYTAKVLQGDAHLIGGIIDSKIPFCNLFIIPYCIWYFLIFFVPYYLFVGDTDHFNKYVISYILCSICADIIFVVYPTTIIRPVIKNNSILNIITNIIYTGDNPSVNCMPSLHCAISMLFILTSFSSKNVSALFKYLILFLSILIMASTLFVKQHVFIDFLTGIILAIYVYIFVINNKLLLNKTKKILRL